MSSNTLTKKRRVMNYLASGKGLTPNEAKSRFGVGNLRATISDIKSQVEQYGNWRIVTSETSTGKTRYGMKRVVLVDPTFDSVELEEMAMA
mgnify:CR=1 FL=1